jgi:hypothetical protein
MKQVQQPTDVVRIEKSGVRFNAWDTNGVKRTSEITTGARKRAYEGGYLLGRFQMKNSNGGRLLIPLQKYPLLSRIIHLLKFLPTTLKY